MANHETSDALSSKAARVMAKRDPFTDDDTLAETIEKIVADPAGQGARDALHAHFEDWVKDARSLAGSVLSQDETKGKRKTGKLPALGAPYGRQALRDDVTCKGRENDYADDDTPNVRLRKIAANLICYARSKADADDPISEPFGFTLEAMDQYADHVLQVVRDLEQPSAGTSAYEMVAAAETANVEITETLIHMVAATALMRMIGDDSLVEMAETGSASVSFSPADMDAMHRDYIMDATRDGLLTIVRITRRGLEEAPPLPPSEAHLEDRPESLMLQDEPETPFEPQAEAHSFDRPIWAVRWHNKDGDALLARCHDRADAERQIGLYKSTTTPSIENRFCMHPDCPTEHCNQQ